MNKMTNDVLDANWKKLMDYATELGFKINGSDYEDSEGYRTLDVGFDYVEED